MLSAIALTARSSEDTMIFFISCSLLPKDLSLLNIARLIGRFAAPVEQLSGIKRALGRFFVLEENVGVVAAGEDLRDPFGDFFAILRGVLGFPQARVGEVGGIDLRHDETLGFGEAEGGVVFFEQVVDRI